MFQLWSQIADSKIQSTENKVSFLAEQRKMILDAKATLGVGQRLLRGNPERLKMVDMALDYLEEDTARTSGEMRKFSCFADKLFTDEQIVSGTAADEAAARFKLTHCEGIQSDRPRPMLTAGHLWLKAGSAALHVQDGDKTDLDVNE